MSLTVFLGKEFYLHKGFRGTLARLCLLAIITAASSGIPFEAHAQAIPEARGVIQREFGSAALENVQFDLSTIAMSSNTKPPAAISSYAGPLRSPSAAASINTSGTTILALRAGRETDSILPKAGRTRRFDYSCRIWSGLIAGYYVPRWRMYFENLSGAHHDIRKWEQAWTRTPLSDDSQPFADPVEAAKNIIAEAQHP